jgi:hypothetical protein
MNPATRQHLMTVAAQRAHSHPAAVQLPLTQGSDQYWARLRLIHGAVIILAALLWGAGLLTEPTANTPAENLPPITAPTPMDPAGPTGPGPTDSGPTDPTEPALVRLRLDPDSFTMAPGERLPIQTSGIYDDGSSERIPAAELSWDVNNAEEYPEFPDIASVDTIPGPDGILIANSAGEATLTVSTPEAEEPQATAEITVRNNIRNPVGPTDLQNPNSTTAAIP